MPARRLCTLALVVAATGCGHSAAPSGSSAARTSSGILGTIANQMSTGTTPPRAVRHVHLGMSEVRVSTIAPAPRAMAARTFGACWVYTGSGGDSVALVCFRHGVVAFTAGPGTPSAVGRGLRRASR